MKITPLNILKTSIEIVKSKNENSADLLDEVIKESTSIVHKRYEELMDEFKMLAGLDTVIVIGQHRSGDELRNFIAVSMCNKTEENEMIECLSGIFNGIEINKDSMGRLSGKSSNIIQEINQLTEDIENLKFESSDVSQYNLAKKLPKRILDVFPGCFSDDLGSKKTDIIRMGISLAQTLKSQSVQLGAKGQNGEHYEDAAMYRQVERGLTELLNDNGDKN